MKTFCFNNPLTTHRWVMAPFAACRRRLGFRSNVSGINPDLRFPNCATILRWSGLTSRRSQRVGVNALHSHTPCRRVRP
jgi:hypothetical protein